MITILVVDDETNIADGIAATLRTGLDIDADIHVCYGAQPAKEYAAEHYIDLIVCDINMPKQNGLSLCRELLAQYPDLKIIFLTGYSDFSYTYEAMKLPDVSYVLKLEDDNVLLDAVRKKLRAQEEERHRRAELMRERQRSDRLAAQLSDLRFEKAVTLDVDMAYCGFVFLLMQFASPVRGVRPFLEGAFSGKVCAVEQGSICLAAIKAGENIHVTQERANRLQQELFDETGVYSVFVFDRPCEEEASRRFARLKNIGNRRADVLYFLDAAESAGQPVSAEADELIGRIVAYIDDHLGEELSLTVLSDFTHYNPAYLSRKFKQITGENLHVYILNKRLALAEKLLMESDAFVQDIAAKCGFPNPTQFGIAFMKYKGCSPSAFRRSPQE